MVIEDSVEFDPYGLDGKTYGIAYHTEDVKAAALTAEMTLNRIVSDKMIVRRDILDNSGNLLVAPDKDIVEWTFKCVEGNNYYI
ncbi:MAG: hypothetical protein IJL71_02755 [Oscillospiraceae bacterium]|nr:hypothetical protein [Oscillospiraceae bacterium]